MALRSKLPAEKSSVNVLSLEQLIAEIERETSEIPSLDDAAPEYAGKSLEIPEQPVFEREQFIRFYLNDILLAIPLQSALEIGHRPVITPLPNLPDWVLGVSNIRGEIISIVDLKNFLGLSSHGIRRNRRFVVAHNRDMKVGLVVDRILDILTCDLSETEVQESPYEEGEISVYISGVITSAEYILNILDINKLLTSSRMTAFRSD